MATMSELAERRATALETEIVRACDGASVSLFANAFDKDGSVDELAEVLLAIARCDLAEDIRKLRARLANGERKAYDSAKRGLPAFAVSAVLAGRDAAVPVAERVVVHTGLLQADFDGKGNTHMTVAQMVEALRGDPHVMACFVSPSGQGVKALVRIPADAARHGAAFDAASRYFLDKYTLAMDPAARDVGRLCFLSSDPDLGVNPAAVAMPVPAGDAPGGGGGGAAPPATGPAFPDPTVEDIREMLSFIPPMAGQYEDWLKVTSAVFSALPMEQAVQVLEAWTPPKHAGDYERKWKHRLQRVGVGTLAWYAKKHGFDARAAARRKMGCGRSNSAGRNKSKAGPGPTEEVAEEIVSRFFYDGKRFYGPGDKGETVPLGKADVSRMLDLEGIENVKDGPRHLDIALNKIQLSQFALRVGPMSGHPKGWHDVPCGRIYVTNEARPVSPAAVPWDMLGKLLLEMLGEEQLGWFLRWLGIGHRSLAERRYRPGQALALVGERSCGKSLLVGLVVEAFGGRAAHPYPQWANGSQFNGHMVAAETLVIDDESPSRDMRARRSLGTAIKSSLFSDSVGIEDKYGQPFSCRPWWRCVIACNDEPENVMVLPPMDDAMEDKIALLWVRRPDFPPGIEIDEGRQAFRKQLSEQLPGLLHAALLLPTAPYEIDGRTGIKSVHAREVLERLRELSREALLEDIIMRAAGQACIVLPWQGSAGELHRLLMDGVGYAFRDETRRLAETATSMGYLLRELSKSRPNMVSQVRRGQAGTIWKIGTAR